MAGKAVTLFYFLYPLVPVITMHFSSSSVTRTTISILFTMNVKRQHLLFVLQSSVSQMLGAASTGTAQDDSESEEEPEKSLMEVSTAVIWSESTGASVRSVHLGCILNTMAPFFSFNFAKRISARRF